MAASTRFNWEAGVKQPQKLTKIIGMCEKHAKEGKNKVIIRKNGVRVYAYNQAKAEYRDVWRAIELTEALKAAQNAYWWDWKLGEDTIEWGVDTAYG